jgi:hypothetical protein
MTNADRRLKGTSGAGTTGGSDLVERLVITNGLVLSPDLQGEAGDLQILENFYFGSSTGNYHIRRGSAECLYTFLGKPVGMGYLNDAVPQLVVIFSDGAVNIYTFRDNIVQSINKFPAGTIRLQNKKNPVVNFTQYDQSLIFATGVGLYELLANQGAPQIYDRTYWLSDYKIVVSNGTDLEKIVAGDFLRKGFRQVLPAKITAGSPIAKYVGIYSRQTATYAGGNSTITVKSTLNLYPNLAVSGTNIPEGVVVDTILSGTQLTIKGNLPSGGGSEFPARATQIYTTIDSNTVTILAPAPTIAVVEASGVAGNLSSGTYSYRMCPVVNGIEQIPSALTSAPLGATGAMRISWADTTQEKASAYNIYGRSTTGTRLIATVPYPGTTFVDSDVTTIASDLDQNISVSGASGQNILTSAGLFTTANSNGRLVVGSGIPDYTYALFINSSTVKLSSNLTGAVSGSLAFKPFIGGTFDMKAGQLIEGASSLLPDNTAITEIIDYNSVKIENNALANGYADKIIYQTPLVFAIGDTSDLFSGLAVDGVGIAEDTTVVSVIDQYTVSLSIPATTSFEQTSVGFTRASGAPPIVIRSLEPMGTGASVTNVTLNAGSVLLVSGGAFFRELDGSSVTGAGIPANAIATYRNPSEMTLNIGATANSTTATLKFTPYVTGVKGGQSATYWVSGSGLAQLVQGDSFYIQGKSTIQGTIANTGILNPENLRPEIDQTFGLPAFVATSKSARLYVETSNLFLGSSFPGDPSNWIPTVDGTGSFFNPITQDTSYAPSGLYATQAGLGVFLLDKNKPQYGKIYNWSEESQIFTDTFNDFGFLPNSVVQVENRVIGLGGGGYRIVNPQFALTQQDQQIISGNIRDRFNQETLLPDQYACTIFDPNIGQIWSTFETNAKRYWINLDISTVPKFSDFAGVTSQFFVKGDPYPICLESKLIGGETFNQLFSLTGQTGLDVSLNQDTDEIGTAITRGLFRSGYFTGGSEGQKAFKDKRISIRDLQAEGVYLTAYVDGQIVAVPPIPIYPAPVYLYDPQGDILISEAVFVFDVFTKKGSSIATSCGNFVPDIDQWAVYGTNLQKGTTATYVNPFTIKLSKPAIATGAVLVDYILDTSVYPPTILGNTGTPYLEAALFGRPLITYVNEQISGVESFTLQRGRRLQIQIEDLCPVPPYKLVEVSSRYHLVSSRDYAPINKPATYDYQDTSLVCCPLPLATPSIPGFSLTASVVDGGATGGGGFGGSTSAQRFLILHLP